MVLVPIFRSFLLPHSYWGFCVACDLLPSASLPRRVQATRFHLGCRGGKQIADFFLTGFTRPIKITPWTLANVRAIHESADIAPTHLRNWRHDHFLCYGSEVRK
jgi:hypothetical protein